MVAVKRSFTNAPGAAALAGAGCLLGLRGGSASPGAVGTGLGAPCGLGSWDPRQPQPTHTLPPSKTRPGGLQRSVTRTRE